MQVGERQLHFGIQLQAQRTTWLEYAQALRAVEDLGFGSVFNFDHLLPFSGPDDEPCFETLTTLSAMAMLTTRVRVGVLVNGVLYRDPATLAKASAQVDEMSSGRLDFSLGAAWAEREFRAYGLDYPPLAERYERLDEALQIVRALWQNERTSFEGRFYRVEDAPLSPKPMQRPHPPIMIGGSGLGSLRIAARHADRLNLIGSPERCAARIAVFERCCAEAGRDEAEIELSVHPTLALGASAEEGEALAQRIAASHQIAVPDERGAWLIGGPAEVIDQCRRFIDVGISHFIMAVGHPFDLDPLRRFQEEVLPALERSR